MIRLASIDDMPAIARVHVDTWRTTYVGIVPDEHLAKLSYERSQIRWVEYFSNTPGIAVFVTDEPEVGVVGFASCGPLREAVGDYDGELYGLYILKEHQGRGIGRALVKRVVEDLNQRGLRSMIIWALKENPACGFYERLGGIRVAEKEVEIGGKALVDMAFGWPDISDLRW